MEVLSACIKNATSNVNFKFHWGAKQLRISHLTFADDVLLFCYANEHSIAALMEGISSFSGISGLYPNKGKCSAFFCNVPTNIVNFALELTGFQKSTLPITYLGLPLISGKLNSRDCLPLVLKLCRRIEVWTCRFLSFAGRLQLIKSVLFSIQGYWSAYLFLPKGVLKKIQGILANFFWGGTSSSTKQHKVAWSDVCMPIAEGGLGIRNLITWNQASILFQLWRIVKNFNSSLWISWLRCFLLRNKGFWTMKSCSYCSWAVKKILDNRPIAMRYIKYVAGRNSNFLLWHDPWLRDAPLLNQFDSRIVAAMQSSSLAKLSTFMQDDQWVTPVTFHVWAIELCRLLSNISIAPVDVITWSCDTSIKTSDIYEAIRCHTVGPLWLKSIWHRFAIKRCSFILWLALKNRLLTKDRMANFGMNVDPCCVLCNQDVENVSHLFCTCSYAQTILSHCPSHLNANWTNLLLGNFFLGQESNIKADISYLYLAITVHAVWRERNNRIHGVKALPAVALTELIKSKMREKLFTCNSFRLAIRKDRTLLALLY